MGAFNGERGQLKGTGALATAVDIAKDVVSQYSIDADRVYVTGSSNGAVGTFAAMSQYGDMFAAGAAVNGAWHADDAAALSSVNLMIYHGTEDHIFPFAYARSLADAIEAAGGQPEFVEMTGVGHDSWPAYRDQRLWDWLLNQTR